MALAPLDALRLAEALALAAGLFVADRALARLHTRLRIDPLTPQDSAHYLQERLRRAGCDRELFEHDALALLHEATLGSMRELDRLATDALRLAAAKKRRLIGRDLITLILNSPLSDSAA